MKAKNSSRKHGAKLSFVVDRDEIDINSDWVSAVLRSPAVGKSASDSSENATVKNKTTVTENTTVEPITSVEVISPVAFLSTGELYTPVALNAPVEKPATVEAAREEETGAKNATVVPSATAVAPTLRKHRPRIIRSILDGFTPGQFTVYSLMWHKGEDSGGAGKRLFAGGYRALCDLTGMSKRGVQNVISELQEKQAISIHQAPGYHRSQFSVYQVLAEDQLLRLWQDRGYKYAVGKGKQLVNAATVD